MLFQLKKSMNFLFIILIIIATSCATKSQKDTPIYLEPIDKIVYEGTEKEVQEIKVDFTDKKYQKIIDRLHGYFNAHSINFVEDLIHNNPGISLQLLSTLVAFNEKNYFDQLYEIAIKHEQDERNIQMIKLYNNAWRDCPDTFIGAMRIYLHSRELNDIESCKKICVELNGIF